MAYNATYTEANIADATVNTIVKAILTIGLLITIVIVAVMYAWVRKRV